MELTAELTKKFPNFKLHVQFSVPSGITVLFGRSGSGKSTTLKMLAGLLKPDDGEIRFNEQIIFNSISKINLKPQSRKFGYVFQNHSLFPHLSIIDNIAFGAPNLSKKEQLEMARQKIHMFRLEGQEYKFPHEISGGQQQRASLARAIIGNPQALLLDEPFSAIDVPTRMNMRNCLKRVMLNLNLPVILVTHDLIEAFSMGDKILIYENGQIIQQGAPSEIIEIPVSEEVKILTNSDNYKMTRIFCN